MNRIFATHAERAVQKSWTGDFSGLGNTFNTMAKLWPRVWKLLSGVFVVELAAAFWPLVSVQWYFAFHTMPRPTS